MLYRVSAITSNPNTHTHNAMLSNFTLRHPQESRIKDMKKSLKVLIFMFFSFSFEFHTCIGAKQEGSGGGDDENAKAIPTRAQDSCNGIFLSYDFINRKKEYPHLNNATAQPWAFKSTAALLNTGIYELKAWILFIGFQHREILVSANGAVLMNGGDFPAEVGNGTFFSGNSQPDLKTSIETAGDLTQIQVQIQLTGTQFGVKPPGIPMPKTIKLVNDGFQCPAPTRLKSSMHVCCLRNPKIKAKDTKMKFLPRQKGDLSITYDVLQVYVNNYQAQVTIDNDNPLGRLDHWNLTWEWMRGEFIYSMKGAYPRKIDALGCIYGPAGKYYADMDFSKVMNCQKSPIITDLPPQRANDSEVGKIPYCCRNGSILPTLMDGSKSRSIFQMQVFKIPPDLNRTALYPPEKWKIMGVLNPNYKCGRPIKVDPTEFPDPSGLQTTTTAVATWQIVCNITRPKGYNPKCCVSFSAYYNASVIPCNTCACGCDDTEKCNPNAAPLLLPPEALLVPFRNRTTKALAWAKVEHFDVPRKLPCGDNCGVSINWHVSSDYTSGWAARVTLFNWEEINFEDWFVAVQMKKAAQLGYENVYSFNGTLLSEINHTIFFQGLKGLNFLTGQTNGTNPKKDPKVPGKQQSVISFTKRHAPGIRIAEGDGFPSKVIFNGEECSLPKHFPTGNGNLLHVNLVLVILVTLVNFVMMNYHL